MTMTPRSGRVSTSARWSSRRTARSTVGTCSSTTRRLPQGVGEGGSGFVLGQGGWQGGGFEVFWGDLRVDLVEREGEEREGVMEALKKKKGGGEGRRGLLEKEEE